MDISKFPSQKRAIFRKIKEIKELRGDVPRYVAQEIPQIDKEVAEKGRFRTETRLNTSQLATVRANPGHRVPADAPLIFLHTRKTDLKAAIASPAKLLLCT
ncbi:MAG: hypothetical protein WBH05_04485, partial [Syntrophobacteria bacterium]